MTFYSAEFEGGVREHLGLNPTDPVLQSQMDTITTLNLAGLGITDIRDVVYLTNVRNLNLSGNEIKDLLPMLPLEKLSVLDISSNSLVDVSVLAFSSSECLTVFLESNYIDDFSCLYGHMSCELTLIGMNSQRKKEALFFDIYHLFACINNDGRSVVNYRGYTNMAAAANLKYGASNVSAQLDGNTYQVAVTEEPTETTRVTLSNGEKSEETYVVPSAIYSVGAGKTATLETGLPDDYYISSAYALKGSVEIDGNRMKYTAPAKAVSDIVFFRYYQGSNQKGFSRFSVNMGKKGDVNISGIVDVQDATLAVNYILGKSSDEYDYVAADMNGDNQVDVFDVTAIINAIFNESGSLSAARSLARQEGDLEKVRLTASENGLLIGIDRANRFTSFQFDVEVPQGTDLLDVTWNGNTKHSLQFARIGENRYRVVALSMSSAPLPASDEALLCLQLSGIPDGSVWVGNVLFVTPEGKALRLNGDTMNMTTGIQGISHTQGEQIYDISGRQLDKKREQLGKGVYIINNKKVVIK